MSIYDYDLEYNLCLSQYENQESIEKALMLIQEAVFREDIEKFLYSYLVNNSASKEDTLIVMEIYKNELKHLEYFNQIYNQLSKNIPQQKLDINYFIPKSFCDGLRYALSEEQNKYQKYNEIYIAIKNDEHKYKLVEILTDEIWHIRLLKYLYIKNSC